MHYLKQKDVYICILITIINIQYLVFVDYALNNLINYENCKGRGFVIQRMLILRNFNILYC